MLAKTLLLLIFVSASFPVQAIDFDEARHLLARTGFGLPKAQEIASISSLNYETAVEALLDTLDTKAQTPPPVWLSEIPPTAKHRKGWTADQKKAFNVANRAQWRELKAWWLSEMRTTRFPFRERMVLFWHNHFTSSLKKVRWAGFIYHQNQLFRQNAVGNFASLLNQIAKDPAMLIYLDGQKNKKGQPNENFAREVMELFTLGEGPHYTETDIREAARAFTGWGVNFKTGAHVLRKRMHDNGKKTVLGVTGNLSGDQVIQVLLEQPQTAQRISAKLWRTFVGQDPSVSRAQSLAAGFRDSNFELRPLLKVILMSAEFRSSKARGQMIKSPVDFVVGTLRYFDRTDIDTLYQVKLLRRLGQDLLDPPNVKGWKGGTGWITTQTMAIRNNFLHKIARGLRKGSAARMGTSMATDTNDLNHDRRDGMTAQALLAVAPINVGSAPSSGARQWLLDPVFHLK